MCLLFHLLHSCHSKLMTHPLSTATNHAEVLR
jgi:hypothetical protein